MTAPLTPTALGLIALAAGACTAAILGALLRSGVAWKLATDVPNQRSLHTRPTPRVGGWAVTPVVALGGAVLAPNLWVLALAAALLALLSFLDDRRGLPARVRFAAHLAAALAVLAAYPAAAPWFWLAMLGVLLIWLINLYNFMDGADGLAGGMTVIGFAAYAAAAYPQWPQLAVLAALTAGAGGGFLIFNRAPATVFLGDAGSIPLGFLAGGIGYAGWARALWPVWFPALVFLPFIADASVTLLRRLLRAEKFWQAHREHYYQRLVLMGGAHAPVVRGWYALMLASAIIALTLLRAPLSTQWGAVALWVLVLGLMGWRVDRRWRHYLKARHETDVST